MRKLLKLLRKAAAYPEPTTSVRLIETHVSYLFVTDDFVYKVKKPVDLGFLNFTSLDRRRFYCEEEVRLNRRLSPEVYLGVVELRATPEGAAFGGSGTLIDYAVKMKRLPEERMLSFLLEEGSLQPEQLAEIARVIARFHGRAARSPRIDLQGSPGAIRAVWEESLRQAAPFVPDILPATDFSLLRGYLESFLSENEALLLSRVAGGFIRECDGDLHLGNICLTDEVCIFDCIEFNERFRFIDTTADIAFLLMDLEYAGRADLCPGFLAAYQEATGDRVAPSLLDFYQAQRALVRGTVLSLRLQESGVPPEERTTALAKARGYFRLARGYALRQRLPPTLILTCGVMGSGKSAWAREFSFQLGATWLRSDLVRKALAGRRPTERESEAYHAGIYAPENSRATYRELLERARRELAAGRSVLVDATFCLGHDRERFRALAGELGAPFFLVQTLCDESLLKERLERRSREPGEVSDGRPELLQRQLAEFEKPRAGEALCLDSSRPLAEEIDLVLKEMGLLP